MNKKIIITIGILTFLFGTIFLIYIKSEQIFRVKTETTEDKVDKKEEKVEKLGVIVDKSNVKEEKGIIKEEIINKYNGKIPLTWGEKVDGVITKLNIKDKVIALTFDACGGTSGNGFDNELIDFLIKEKVPATLFINYRWIEANKEAFLELSRNPLFEIENHGYMHKPLSVNGKSVYNIKGTENPGEVFDEISLNEKEIEKLTGRKPKFFRAGTAYYDELAVKISNDIGEKSLGFNIIGDAGATFSKEQIIKACAHPVNGSIFIFHMNHPEKSTYEGLSVVIPELKNKGFSFIKVEDYIGK